MSIDAKLNEEIERDLDAIHMMKVGSEEHTASIRNLKELLGQVIDMQRLDYEEKDRTEKRTAEERAREAEERAKFEERKNAFLDRLIGHVINGVIGVGGLIAMIWAFIIAMKYEEFGTISSKGGNLIFNRFMAFIGRK
jgi:hypothetical protein